MASTSSTEHNRRRGNKNDKQKWDDSPGAVTKTIEFEKLVGDAGRLVAVSVDAVDVANDGRGRPRVLPQRALEQAAGRSYSDGDTKVDGEVVVVRHALGGQQLLRAHHLVQLEGTALGADVRALDEIVHVRHQLLSHRFSVRRWQLLFVPAHAVDVRDADVTARPVGWNWSEQGQTQRAVSFLRTYRKKD